MSNELSKATLARKDKDELTQIAAAMGGKPSSRARKAEIVELIMELAGVGTSAAAASPADNHGDDDEGDGAADRSESAPAAGSGSAPRSGGYTADPMADARAAEARSGGDGGVGAARNGSAQGGGRNPQGNDAANRGRAARSAGDHQSRADQGGDDHGADDHGTDDHGGEHHGGDDRGGDDQADRGDDGKDDGSGDGKDQDASGDSSRRRRRRGRNRDRNDNGEEWTGEPVDVEGFLDLRDDGYGFLRVDGFLPSKEDVYVSVKQVRQYELRKGDHLTGAGRPANRSEKNPALVRIDTVNGRDPEQAVNRVNFDELTPVHPTEALTLGRSDDGDDITGRLIDLVSPVGRGQRGLIAVPPLADKLRLLESIARAIETNHEDVELLVLLIDERPEDVTEMETWLERGEVIASTFDRPAEEHLTVAELTLERALRMVEMGRDVVLLLDGLTRLTRAYNASGTGPSRSLPGGLDANAVYPSKRFFGAARNLEEGGSLTILATARIENGSSLDQAILEEFAETANMELHLCKRAAERRIHPPVDITATGTRRAELMVDPARLDRVQDLRDRVARADDAVDGLVRVLAVLREHPDDEAALAALADN